MRISAYARATNPKYANFFGWKGLAGQLGTTGGAAKLGAGIGAGVGAINYLGSDDKSVGNLATQVGGGAALGGAVGYGGYRFANRPQAPAAPQKLIGAAQPATTTSAGATVQQSNGTFVGQPAANASAQSPTAQSTSSPTKSAAPSNPQTIDTTAITVPTASGQTQSGNSQPYPLTDVSGKSRTLSVYRMSAG